MNKKFVFYYLLLTFHLPALLLHQAGVSHLTFHVYAQQPTQEWVRRYSGTSNNGSSGLSVKLDASGNVYVLVRVYTDSTLDDYGVIKYSPTGVLLWQAIYNTPGNFQDQVKAFAVTSTGEIYVTGISGIDFVYRILTVKFNSDGIFQWAKVYNGGGPGDGAYDIATDKQENIVITGATSINNNTGYALTVKYNPLGDTVWVRKFDLFQSSVSSKLVLDDSCNVYVTGYHTLPYMRGNFLTLKYNRNGSLIWYSSYGDINVFAIANNIDIDTNRNIYVVGTYNNFITGYSDNALVKIQSNGDTAWTRLYKGIVSYHSVQQPKGIAVTPDGSAIYYTTFCANGMGGGANDIVTLKYNSSGDSVWVRRYGGGVFGTNNAPAALKLDKNYNVYVTGSVYFSVSGNDYVTIKYLPTGIQQWIATYNGPLTNSIDAAFDLFVDTNLRVYVTGVSSRQNNPILADAATVKYNQPIGIISNNNKLPKNFKLRQNYPNPFNNSTVIDYEIPERSYVELKVYNTIGQWVKTLVNGLRGASYYTTVLNTEDFSSGIYFYSLAVNNLIIDTKKFIIVK